MRTLSLSLESGDSLVRFRARLVELSGLPLVRLHDLRHLAATLSLLAGNDIKVVQEKLGHSSRQITSDTYTSVLPEMMRAEAESVMAVVPRETPFDIRTPLELPDTIWQDGLPSSSHTAYDSPARSGPSERRPVRTPTSSGWSRRPAGARTTRPTRPSGGYAITVPRTPWSWSASRTSTTAVRRSSDRTPTTRSRRSIDRPRKAG
ncbi:tyrosine-type recombinase/integrase [Streptomyces sp. NPDC006356]